MASMTSTKDGAVARSSCRKRTGEAWISRALSRNAALYFANADDAEEKIGRSLPFEPRHDRGIALPPAQLR